MNTRTKTLVCGSLAALFLAGPLLAQDPERRRRRRARPAATPQDTKKPETKKPAKKEDEKKAAKVEKVTAFVGGTVHVGNGTTLRRATIVIKGSKIESIGRDTEIPKEATRVDCTGKHISPGFLIYDLTGVGAPFSVNKDDKYVDSIDPFNAMMKRALSSGITSYLASGRGGSSTPSGTSAVIKMIPGQIEGSIVKEDLLYSMRVPLGADGWRKLEKSVADAKKYQAELADYEKKKAAGDKKAKAPKKPKGADELIALMKGEKKLRVGGGVSRGRGRRMFGGGGGMTKPYILEALKLAKLFGHGIILDNPAEGWIVADEIASTGSSCILKPRLHVDRDKTRSDPHGSRIEAAAMLAQAGVPLHLLPPGGMMGAGIGNGGLLGRDLNTPTVDPCFAIRGGLPEDEALLTLTLYPAMMLGVDDRIGSLEVGKDADLLIHDGPPLHYRTFVETAIVHGVTAYEKSKEPFYKNHPGRQ